MLVEPGKHLHCCLCFCPWRCLPPGTYRSVSPCIYITAVQILRHFVILSSVTIIQVACLLPAFNMPFVPSSARAQSTLRSQTTKYKFHIGALLSTLTLLSLLSTLYRLPQAPPQPFKPGPRIINTGIWTVHFGIDNEGHDSQQGIMNLIRYIFDFHAASHGMTRLADRSMEQGYGA